MSIQQQTPSVTPQLSNRYFIILFVAFCSRIFILPNEPIETTMDYLAVLLGVIQLVFGIYLGDKIGLWLARKVNK